MFPVNVQGTTMFAGTKPFKKWMHGQIMQSQKCQQCKTCSCNLAAHEVDDKLNKEDTNICRVCGDPLCDNCVVQHVGWCDALMLDISIKLCLNCANDWHTEENPHQAPSAKNDRNEHKTTSTSTPLSQTALPVVVPQAN